MEAWVLLLSSWLTAAALAAGDGSRGRTPAEPSPPAPLVEPTEATRDIGLVETMEIDGRLVRAEPGPASAPSQRLAGAALRRAGGRSVPEALARQASVLAIDQVGNGRQLSIDLRGFSGAEGATALVIDGVRVNDPDTHVAAWEMLRLDEIELVELVAGPRGTSLGGGALAGVVHVTRRRPTSAIDSSARVRAGSFGFRDLSASVSGPAGGWRLLASAGAFEEDGFRDDSGSRERALRLAAERDVAGATLALDWSVVDGRWSQPGALKDDEIGDNPAVVPFNDLDLQDSRQHLLTARLERDGERTRLVSVAGFRDRATEILATGRSCYGYRTRDSQQSLTLASEAETDLRPRARHALRLRWGGEAASERLHPRGWATDDTCDGEIHVEELATATDVNWNRLAAFTALEADLPGGFGVEVGARHDRSRIVRAGVELGASGRWEDAGGKRSFADTTWRLAAGRAWDRPGWSLRWGVAWEQSFLSPSAIQLFAYPGFLSNPELRPQRGSGPSLTLAWRRGALDLGFDAYETRVADEIAYDDERLQNVNAGSTRRRGVELRLDWEAAERVRVRAGLGLMNATYRKGFAHGTRVVPGVRVPLVPSNRATLALELGPWRGVTVDAVLVRSGRAALSNDFDGSEPRLEARRQLSAAARWALPRARGLELELAADNIFDDRHPSRGIEAWGVRYYTPPAPRSITLGIAWRLP